MAQYALQGKMLMHTHCWPLSALTGAPTAWAHPFAQSWAGQGLDHPYALLAMSQQALCPRCGFCVGLWKPSGARSPGQNAPVSLVGRTLARLALKSERSRGSLLVPTMASSCSRKNCPAESISRVCGAWSCLCEFDFCKILRHRGDLTSRGFSSLRQPLLRRLARRGC